MKIKYDNMIKTYLDDKMDDSFEVIVEKRELRLVIF